MDFIGPLLHQVLPAIVSSRQGDIGGTLQPVLWEATQRGSGGISESGYPDTSDLVRCRGSGDRECSAWMGAAREYGVNVLALYAVAIQETGVRWTDGFVRPWPWTLNSPATGALYFRTYEDCLRSLEALLTRGETNVDVGLMQINVRANGWRIGSLAQLLVTKNNIRVAAQIIREGLTSHGEDWKVALARYHSPRDELGVPYANAVMNTIRALASSLHVVSALTG